MYVTSFLVINAVVPESVKFECDSANMPSIVLKKDNATVVRAKIQNSSVIMNNKNFKGTVFTDSGVLLELITSKVKDEGMYLCLAVNETTEVVGKRYMLKVFSKLNCYFILCVHLNYYVLSVQNMKKSSNSSSEVFVVFH